MLVVALDLPFFSVLQLRAFYVFDVWLLIYLWWLLICHVVALDLPHGGS